VFGDLSGFWVTPSCEVWSNVMSWSVNCPTKAEPAVIVGLSGLVPYGSIAVGLPLMVGSVISNCGWFGAPNSWSPASRIARCIPTSSNAARTLSVALANGRKSGKIRPKSMLLAGAPVLPLGGVSRTQRPRLEASSPRGDGRRTGHKPSAGRPHPLQEVAARAAIVSFPIRHSRLPLAFMTLRWRSQ
jgi:hypothetical protein